MIKRGVWVCFAILIILTILLSVSSNVYGKDSGVKVSSEVTKELQNNGKARVIVVLKDNNDFDSKGKLTASASSSRTNVIENIGKEKVKNEFSSFNGFSAALTADEIAKLETDNRVESIQYDMPVSIFLQDSVPLINASLAWPVQLNGTNITGAGETICIIDTGVDYTHPDLGNCTIKNLSLIGNNVSYILETAHLYNNGNDTMWKINYTGFSKIAVHFMNISMEDFFDYIIIYDGNKNEIATYSGFQQDLWTPSVDGDTIYVRLKTDEAITDYGFYIDQIINGTTNTTYNWSSCGKVVGGWDIYDSDPDPKDEQGHGTHVAGIAAANGAIKGVAPDAKLVIAKVFPAGTSTYGSVIIEGIEWCTNNSNLYNISVISMSLGAQCYNSTGGWTGYCYNSYCDTSEPYYSRPINDAVRKNISVVIASGNDGNYSYISAPACIRNATAVGSVNKSDIIANDCNRNNITDLFAPGVSIVSTCVGGISCSKSGTSMATPHVAGAFALVRQFERLKTGNIMKPAEIENVLNKTGKRISDTGSGLNFSRINVYSALQELDKPVITVSSPQSTYYKSKSVLINISSSAQQTIWWSNGTANITYSLGYHNFSEGNNTIYVYANGSLGGVNSTTIILDVDTISPTINFTNPTIPEGNYSQSWIRANVTANDTSLDRIIIYLFNSTALYQQNASIAGAGTLFVNFTNLADGIYYLNASANDSAGNTNWTEKRTIILDNAPPFFASIWPANISWTNGLFNISLNEAGFCWLVLNGTNYTMANNSGMTQFYYINSSINETNASNALNVTFYCNDTLGHLNSSETRFFGIDNTPPIVELTSPSHNNKTTSSSMTFKYKVNDSHSISKCEIFLDSSIIETDPNVPKDTEQSHTQSGISIASHTWYVQCTDEAGNIGGGASSHRDFERESTTDDSNGDSTSPDNNPASTEDIEYEGTKYNISDSAFKNGTSKRLQVKDWFVFSINKTSHTLTVLSINTTGNSTKIRIRSSTITDTIKVGDEKKYELTGDSYLDLYVRLNDLRYGRANLTIKEIYEKTIVNVTNVAGTKNENVTGGWSKFKEKLGNAWTTSIGFVKGHKWWFIGGGIVAIIAAGVFILHRKGYRFNFHIIEHKD